MSDDPKLSTVTPGTDAAAPPTSQEADAQAQGATSPFRAAGRLALRAGLLGLVPGMVLYGAFFGLCIWLHRSVEYMGVEDNDTASRVLALFEDEVVAQQLGLFQVYLAIGALVGLVAFTWVELLTRVRRKPIVWWAHGVSTVALGFGIHLWFLMRSAYHYPQLYAPQAPNSTLLDVAFSLGVDVLEPWFLSLLSMAFWVSAATMVLVLLYRWALVGPADTRQVRQRRALVAAGLLLGVPFGWAAASGGPSLRAGVNAEPTKPNILLIAVDSLRGDVVGDGTITPNIDRFALKGTRFTHAFTVMPRTFPAWASILTGQYPHTHGIRHMFPEPDKGDKIPGSIATTLSKQGYRTALISDHAGDVFTRGEFGFDHLDAPEFTLRSNVRLGGLKLHVHLMPYLVDIMKGDGAPELMANERLGDPEWLTDRALSWIAGDDAPEDGRGRPFFATVFYSAGHFPFAAPAPFYRKFADPDYRGRSRFHKEAYGKPLEGEARAAEEKHLRHLFLGALAASDHAIGRLLSQLDKAGVLDNTIVIITADHGENLYEHGLGVGHGDHLYGLPAVHVPMIVKLPDAQNKALPGARRLVAHESVRLVDIAPTLLAQTGVKPSADHPMEGVDLTPYTRDSGETLPSLPAFAETGLWFYPPETERLAGKMIRFAAGFDAFRYQPETWKIYLDPVFEETAVMAKHRMLLEGDRKLLYIPTRDGVRWEMYDPYADPGETQNLIDREPKRFAAMKSRLIQWMLRDPQMVRVGDYVLPRGPLGPIAERSAP